MPDRYFLDTNIFVYSFDQGAPAKQRSAQTLIQRALNDHSGVVSSQVIQEFLNVATRKFQPNMTPSEAETYLNTVLAPLCEVFASLTLFQTALSIRDETGYSFYDSLIVAAAKAANCRYLLSEDLQAGRVIRDLEVRNPFAP